MNGFNYVAKFAVKNGEFTPEIRAYAAKLRAENPGKRVCYFYNGPRVKLCRIYIHNGEVRFFEELNRNTYKRHATEVRLYLHDK